MSRVMRVMALLEHLRGVEDTTVPRLAKLASTSVRSTQRDLATLRELGFPIAGEPGPGGGVRLQRARGLLSVNLTVSEAASLWLAARLSQGEAHLPWSSAVEGALAKLLTSLPPAKAAGVRELFRRVIVGPPAGFLTREGA